MLQVRELMDDALHHMSAGVACLHCYAVLLECLGQLGWEGALVMSRSGHCVNVQWWSRNTGVEKFGMLNFKVTVYNK
jgi:hypothetical protein